MKDSKFEDSGKQKEGKMFHKLHVLGMNDELQDRVAGSWVSTHIVFRLLF